MELAGPYKVGQRSRERNGVVRIEEEHKRLGSDPLPKYFTEKVFVERAGPSFSDDLVHAAALACFRAHYWYQEQRTRLCQATRFRLDAHPVLGARSVLFSSCHDSMEASAPLLGISRAVQMRLGQCGKSISWPMSDAAGYLLRFVQVGPAPLSFLEHTGLG